MRTTTAALCVYVRAGAMGEWIYRVDLQATWTRFASRVYF